MKWHIFPHNGHSPNLATEVYFDLQPSKPIPSKGLAIYVKHSASLRPATANIVQLGDRIFLQTAYHAFHLGSYGKETCDTPPCDVTTLPSIEKLIIVGRLLFWSVDRGWALVEVFSNELNSTIKDVLSKDKDANKAFQTPGTPSDVEIEGYTWTAAGGQLQVSIKGTTTSFKLPNSIYLQDVHRAQLVNGNWSNGDCGAIVTDTTGQRTFGHVLGGNRVTKVALIIAADQVVKDFQDIGDVYQFLEEHNLIHLLHGDISSKVGNEDYGKALEAASIGGKEQVVKLLLDTGKVDVDAKNQDGRTPLSWAVEKGHEAVVKLLQTHSYRSQT